MRKQFLLLASTACYIGFIPGPTGTYAAAATTVVYWWIAVTFHHIYPDLHLSTVCLISVMGVFAAAETSRRFDDPDPRSVVVDEVAGQLLTFLFLPASLTNLILGFALFRIFDIWKPAPIRQLERLPGGIGIMADDLAAGIYANVLLHIFDRLFH